MNCHCYGFVVCHIAFNSSGIFDLDYLICGISDSGVGVVSALCAAGARFLLSAVGDGLPNCCILDHNQR